MSTFDKTSISSQKTHYDNWEMLLTSASNRLWNKTNAHRNHGSSKQRIQISSKDTISVVQVFNDRINECKPQTWMSITIKDLTVVYRYSGWLNCIGKDV